MVDCPVVTATPSTTPATSAVAASTAVSGGRVFASPLAKKIAKETSVDLSAIFPGSGPNGRILKEDVLQAVSSPPVKAAPPVLTTAPTTTAAPSVSAPVVTKTSTPPSKIEGIYEVECL